MAQYHPKTQFDSYPINPRAIEPQSPVVFIPQTLHPKTLFYSYRNPFTPKPYSIQTLTPSPQNPILFRPQPLRPKTQLHSSPNPFAPKPNSIHLLNRKPLNPFKPPPPVTLQVAFLQLALDLHEPVAHHALPGGVSFGSLLR